MRARPIQRGPEHAEHVRVVRSLSHLLDQAERRAHERREARNQAIQAAHEAGLSLRDVAWATRTPERPKGLVFSAIKKICEQVAAGEDATPVTEAVRDAVVGDVSA
jgi:hypothetical protein